MLNIGLVGCGIVTIKAHLPALMNDPTTPIKNHGFKITALCGIEYDKLSYFEDKIPNAKVFNDYKGLIDSGLCNCVLVATGEEIHLEIAQYAIDKDLFVLLEKPASTSAENIKQFISRNKGKVNKIQVGFNKRYYPGFLKYKELKECKELSNIIGGNAVFLTQQGRKEGKTGILSNLIHLCDIVCWIFGNPIDVKAHFSKALNDEKGGKTITASILTECGAVVSLLFTSSSNWNLPYHESMEILDDRKNKLMIRNSNDIIFSKFIDKKITENIIFNQSNSVFWNKDPLGYKTQITNFSKLVKRETENPCPNLFNALIAHEFVERIFTFDR